MAVTEAHEAPIEPGHATRCCRARLRAYIRQGVVASADLVSGSGSVGINRASSRAHSTPPARRLGMRRQRPIFRPPSRVQQFTRLIGLVLAAAVLIVVALTLVALLVSAFT